MFSRFFYLYNLTVFCLRHGRVTKELGVFDDRVSAGININYATSSKIVDTCMIIIISCQQHLLLSSPIISHKTRVMLPRSKQCRSVIIITQSLPCYNIRACAGLEWLSLHVHPSYRIIYYHSYI